MNCEFQPLVPSNDKAIPCLPKSPSKRPIHHRPSVQQPLTSLNQHLKHPSTMQLPFAFALALASTSIPFTFAAPSHSTISKMAPAQWTIVDMARTCDHGICHWSFAVNTTAPGPDADVTHCAFDVHGHPAWQTDSYGQVCGRFSTCPSRAVLLSDGTHADGAGRGFCSRGCGLERTVWAREGVHDVVGCRRRGEAYCVSVSAVCVERAECAMGILTLGAGRIRINSCSPMGRCIRIRRILRRNCRETVLRRRRRGKGGGGV